MIWYDYPYHIVMIIEMRNKTRWYLAKLSTPSRYWNIVLIPINLPGCTHPSIYSTYHMILQCRTKKTMLDIYRYLSIFHSLVKSTPQAHLIPLERSVDLPDRLVEGPVRWPERCEGAEDASLSSPLSSESSSVDVDEELRRGEMGNRTEFVWSCGNCQ